MSVQQRERGAPRKKAGSGLVLPVQRGSLAFSGVKLSNWLAHKVMAGCCVPCELVAGVVVVAVWR